MGKIIIKNPKGKVVKNFEGNPSGRKFVTITYSRRGRLGKFLKLESTKKVKLPPNTTWTSIANNSPKVGSVTINYKKVKK